MGPALPGNVTAKQVGKVKGATRSTSRYTSVCLVAQTTARTTSNPEAASARDTGPVSTVRNRAVASIVDHTEPANKVFASQYTLCIATLPHFLLSCPLLVLGEFELGYLDACLHPARKLTRACPTPWLFNPVSRSRFGVTKIYPVVIRVTYRPGLFGYIACEEKLKGILRLGDIGYILR